MQAEGQLHEAKKPTSTIVKPSARAAEFEQVQGMDVLMGMAESRTAVPLLSDGENGMVHTGMEKVTESDRMLSVSPILLMHGHWERVDDGMGESEDGRVLLLEGNGTQLTDVNGQILYERLGWRLLHDQNGYTLCDQAGNLCFEEVDEDELAMMTWLDPRRAPVTAEQVNSMI